MLNANKEKLNSFFQGSAQYEIPFFQRPYVWQLDNWQQLWENVVEEFDAFKNKESESEHFIGTIICKNKDTGNLGENKYDLIDGQQRLTTVCLLFRALHDCSKDDSLRKWLFGLLVFNDNYGKQKIRIIHSKVDTEYFQRIVADPNNNDNVWNKHEGQLDKAYENENRILAGYLYFRDAISNLGEETDLRDFANILLHKLPVIHMALSQNDDVQQIFDTINSLGVKLTTGELLKNYLYSTEKVQAYYKEYWEDVFEADEDVIDFWETKRTSGRVPRTTIELFLYSYLIILEENPIKMEALFKEYKKYLQGKNADELIAFARELSEYALLYAKIPDGDNLVDIKFDEHDKRFFHVMRELDVTTIFPLILFLYKNVSEPAELYKILNLLEAYVMRRTICRLTTKNYNNLFLALLKDLKKMATITEAELRIKLLGFTEDSNRFPDDEELKEGFLSSHLINQYSREVLFCIALRQLDNDKQDYQKLNSGSFTLEHIMPKKWQNHWELPEDGDEYERRHYLLTLGNLTLTRGKLNISMRDSSWQKKKVALREYSSLKITTAYLNIEHWDEGVIENRGEDLYNLATKIWKH